MHNYLCKISSGFCVPKIINIGSFLTVLFNKLEMWANAQRDGRPAEYRWRPVFNAAKCADAHYSSAVQ